MNPVVGDDLTPPVKFLPRNAKAVGAVLVDPVLYAATADNCGGAANGVWIFQVVSTLTTAAGNSQVIMAGGGQSKNVFWQIGSSATLGTNTTFSGNIMALASITVNTGATLNGRALARNGAVTLDSNQVNVPTCP